MKKSFFMLSTMLPPDACKYVAKHDVMASNVIIRYSITIFHPPKYVATKKDTKSKL